MISELVFTEYNPIKLKKAEEVFKPFEKYTRRNPKNAYEHYKRKVECISSFLKCYSDE